MITPSPSVNRADVGSSLFIEMKSVSTLKPHPSNARTHSNRQIDQIAKSIRAFGWANPPIIDNEGHVLAGAGRLLAAKKLGLERIPTISLANLTKDQIRAYIIADNKIAQNSGWDKQILAIELQHLLSVEGLDFNVSLTGFEMAEIDVIIGDSPQVKTEDEILTVAGGAQNAVSKPGDLWQLGPHRIFCGSSLEEISYQTLMANELATAIFTDPPYNVKIDGHATGNGSIRHREFAMASGEMSETEFSNFLSSVITLLIKYSNPQSVHYVCMDWPHIEALLATGRQQYDRLLNLCVWVKDNGGMGSFYRSQHELIAVFRKGTKSHRNNVQLGRYGRNRTNVWHYPGVQTMSKQGDEGSLLALHPTVKPVKMAAEALLDCTKRGDVVLDSFLGSGTTLMAAERVRRRCHGIELDPLYIDTAVRRWQTYTGNDAIHVASNQTFTQIEEGNSK